MGPVRVSLRDYQLDTLTALEKDWSTGLLRLGVGLPTGTGKTHIMSELANRYASTVHHERQTLNHSGRVLVLVHRDTLVEQTERKMREHAGPGVTVGVVKASRDVVSASITVASVHTLRSETRLARIKPPDLIIVDEAHVSMSPTYARIFERFPTSRVAGFTATWVRSDKKKLGDYWQKISYQRTIRWAIKHGHLVLPKGIDVGVPVEVARGLAAIAPTRTNADYRDEDVAELVTVDGVRDNVVRGYFEHASGRPAALFAPTVASAEYFRQGLMAAGIATEGVYAGTSGRDRTNIFKRFRTRQTSILTTCTALAEGWDAPWCSAVLLVRPTRHVGTYIQMVGRALRLWPGKSDALVLDFVGGTNGLSLSLDAVLSKSAPKIDQLWDDEDDELDDAASTPEEEDGDQLYAVGKGSRPIDLFAGSEARWLTTDAGVPFIATHGHLYFVCQPPGSDLWNVGVCPSGAPKDRDGRIVGGQWLKEGVDPDDAVSFATIVAVDDDPSLARHDVAWRRGKPTQEQIYRARSIGCVLGEKDNRGDVSDKLTLRQASITLAPLALR
jgi:superfamily II DNA or RNA helicase